MQHQKLAIIRKEGEQDGRFLCRFMDLSHTDEFRCPGFAPSRHDEDFQDTCFNPGDRLQPSTLSERIELLDQETRSCWKRVEDLEDEEASLDQELMKLEKTRRGERMEVLTIEQESKSVEFRIIKADEETAQLDEQSRALESTVQDATDDASVAVEAHISSILGGGGDGDPSYRAGGSAELTAVLRNIPPHEEKRQRMASMLQEHESKMRSRIAEVARSAAELRRSKKKREADSLSLGRETTALREDLAAMADDCEVEASMVHARQAGEGLRRRLQHAHEKLASVRDTLAQGSARHLEEEEQRSLELLRGIAEARAKLRSPLDRGKDPLNSSNRSQRNARPATGTPSRAPIQSLNGSKRNHPYLDR